jgi:hypothetical protein
MAPKPACEELDNGSRYEGVFWLSMSKGLSQTVITVG